MRHQSANHMSEAFHSQRMVSPARQTQKQVSSLWFSHEHVTKSHPARTPQGRTFLKHGRPPMLGRTCDSHSPYTVLFSSWIRNTGLHHWFFFLINEISDLVVYKWHCIKSKGKKTVDSDCLCTDLSWWSFAELVHFYGKPGVTEQFHRNKTRFKTTAASTPSLGRFSTKYSFCMWCHFIFNAFIFLLIQKAL